MTFPFKQKFLRPAALALAMTLLSGSAVSCQTAKNLLLGKTGQASRYWNQTARLLAGMPLAKNCVYARFASGPDYRKYAALMDGLWKTVRKENIDEISRWRCKNFRSRYDTDTVVYPFSGGDFINLHSFFPESVRYVLVAMEEPGSMTDPLSLMQSQLVAGLYHLYRSMDSIGLQNYLKTANMRRELYNPYFYGMNPMLLIVLARLECDIVSVARVGLDSNGAVGPLDKNGLLRGSRPRVVGTEIRFLDQDKSRVKTLLYLRLCVGPGVESGRTPEGRFFRSLGDFNMITKSASYVLHLPANRGFCNFLLQNCRVIIQDDSGIPYRYFDAEKWTIRLFGAYDRPVPLSDNSFYPAQPDLAQAFRRASRPLSFHFGYGVYKGMGKSNLLLGVRKRG